MTITPFDVDELFDSVLGTEDDTLRVVRDLSHKAGLPAIEVSVQQGKLLTLLVQMSNAKRVLEIGTLGGYSTICLARGVHPRGSVTTLEQNPIYARLAKEHLNFAQVSNRVNVIVGHALDNLQLLMGPFDFVFIDADKENNAFYVDWAVKLGEPGTVIMVDNIVRDGRVFTVQDKLEFIKRLGMRSDIEVSAIQTVGRKGWDGFILARVK